MIYVWSNNTENYNIYIAFMCRVLEKLRTHFFQRFVFSNTDSQSSPILEKVGGGGGGGAGGGLFNCKRGVGSKEITR